VSDPTREIAWFATKGAGTNEARRIRELLSGLEAVCEWPFSKKDKRGSFATLWRKLRARRPGLMVMEGTGLAGGLICLLGRLLWRVPYIVSSGDAVGPFFRSHRPMFGWLFAIYERVLCRFCAGFIGWTPYLAGRALTFGAPRAVTAAGWPLAGATRRTREEVRRHFGISTEAIVVGIIGALEWNDSRGYGYGWELAKCARQLDDPRFVFLIVGEGAGLARLRKEVESLPPGRVVLPGAVPLEEVMEVISAMDLGSLPQSMDGVGLFRYTTKLSEYAAAGLPVITSQIPVAYDLGHDWMWRLPGEGPWTDEYVGAMTSLLRGLTPEEIEARRRAVPGQLEAFDREAQIARVTSFIRDILASKQSG
jgi:hypothetical protein